MLLPFLVLGPILLGTVWLYGLCIIIVGAILLVPPAVVLAMTVLMERIGLVRRVFYTAELLVLVPLWLTWPLLAGMPAFAPHWMRVVSGLINSTWHGSATITVAQARNQAFVGHRMLEEFLWVLKSMAVYVGAEYAFAILDDFLAYLIPSDALPIRARCDQRFFRRRDGREKGKAIRWYSEPLPDPKADEGAEKGETASRLPLHDSDLDIWSFPKTKADRRRLERYMRETRWRQMEEERKEGRR